MTTVRMKVHTRPWYRVEALKLAVQTLPENASSSRAIRVAEVYFDWIMEPQDFDEGGEESEEG